MLIFYLTILHFCFCFLVFCLILAIFLCVLKWLLPKVLGFAIKLSHVLGTLHALYLFIFSITLWRRIIPVFQVRKQDQKKEVPFPESCVVSGRTKLGFKLDLTLKLSQLSCLLNQENSYVFFYGPYLMFCQGQCDLNLSLTLWEAYCY